MLNLQQYQAEAQQRQAENVLARQQALEDNATDMAYRMYTDDVSTAQNLQKYVDSHNADIYQLMYNAYNSGQAALGNEYAKQLWRLDENGVIQPGSFNTSGAAAYAKRVADYQLSPRTETTPTDIPAKTEDGTREVDALGVPVEYSDYIKNAREHAKNYDYGQACEIVYQIYLTELKRDDGLRDLNNVLAACGVPYKKYQEYMMANHPDAFSKN